MTLIRPCSWCTWPTSSPWLLIENIRERLCQGCRDLVAAYGIANVRL